MRSLARLGLVAVGAALLLIGIGVWRRSLPPRESAPSPSRNADPIPLGNRTDAVRYDRNAFGYRLELPAGATVTVETAEPAEGILDQVTVHLTGTTTVVLRIQSSSRRQAILDLMSSEEQQDVSLGGRNGTLVRGTDRVDGSPRTVALIPLDTDRLMEFSGSDDAAVRSVSNGLSFP